MAIHTFTSVAKATLFFVSLTAVLLGWPAQNAYGQGQSNCELVQGSGFVDADLSKQDEGIIGFTGPVSGDIEGTLRAFRFFTATEQQGRGATFATYHMAELETNDFGTFTGTARSTFNFAGNGTRSTTGIVWAFFDGPDNKEGWLQGVADFDLSGPLPAADFEFQAQLCP